MLEMDIQHLHFYQLNSLEKLHYCLGLGKYFGFHTLKFTGTMIFKFAWFLLSNSALLFNWTLGGVFGIFKNLFNRMFYGDFHNISGDDSSEDNFEDFFDG